MCVVYTVDLSFCLSFDLADVLPNGFFSLFCEIIYLGMTGEVDVSEQDDSVSEHEVLVSLSIIKSSGAGRRFSDKVF